jgi:hypothetical protein
MVLVYLVNKPQVLGRIARWLLLFLEYRFTVVYKLGRTHVGADALSKLLDNSKPFAVPDKTLDVSLFSVEPIWMQEMKPYLEMGQMPKTLNLAQK